MADVNVQIKYQRAIEQMRQETETFDQLKKHDRLWFILRIIMGYSSIVLLLGVLIISSIIIFNNKDFPSAVVTSAGLALFGDILGLIITVWKVVLNPDFSTKLSPITNNNNKK